MHFLTLYEWSVSSFCAVEAACLFLKAHTGCTDFTVQSSKPSRVSCDIVLCSNLHHSHLYSKEILPDWLADKHLSKIYRMFGNCFGMRQHEQSLTAAHISGVISIIFSLVAALISCQLIAVLIASVRPFFKRRSAAGFLALATSNVCILVP